MAIPEQPLKLEFDPGELYLPELELIEGTRGIGAREFHEFLVKYGNWTRAQVEALQRKDLLEIWAEVRRQFYEKLAPKANGTP